jgi:ABC-type polysaccharide/polyol phosphate export permease
VSHIVWLWWYMSPGLYGIDRIPAWARPFYELNPFAHLIPATHSILLKGEFPENWVSLLVIFVASGLFLAAGALFLKKNSYQLYRFI